jgi:hypothetical protein
VRQFHCAPKNPRGARWPWARFNRWIDGTACGQPFTGASTLIEQLGEDAVANATASSNDSSFNSTAGVFVDTMAVSMASTVTLPTPKTAEVASLAIVHRGLKADPVIRHVLRLLDVPGIQGELLF